MLVFRLGLTEPWDARLQSAFMQMPERLPAWVVIASVFLAALALAWAVVHIDLPASKVLVTVSALTEICLLSLMLALFGWWVSPFPAMCAGTIAAGLGLGYGLTAVGGRKRQIDSVFGERLSLDARAELLNRREPLPLGHRSAAATVIHCHWTVPDGSAEEQRHSFRQIEEASRLVAEMLRGSGAYIEGHGPNWMRAVFGFPIAAENHALESCTAGLIAMRELPGTGRLIPHLGIATGELASGLNAACGEPRLFLFGEALDVARKLAQRAEGYRAAILLSPETMAACREEILVRPLDLLELGAEHARMEIYQLAGLRAEAAASDLEAVEAFWRGMILFREKRFAESREAFLKARREGEDPVLELQLRRAEEAGSKSQTGSGSGSGSGSESESQTGSGSEGTRQ